MLGKQAGTQKKKPILQQTDNPVEIIKDLATGVVSSAVNDVIGGVAKTTAEQILGNPPAKIEGTLNPNETINVDELKKGQSKEPSLFWTDEKPVFKPREQLIFNSKDLEVQRKIQEILKELKALAKSVESLNKEAGKVMMEEMPAKPGVYHLNFFEWLLKLLKGAREKVEESASWLRLFCSRKKEKEYWQMFKKHGTTFGLSHERVVATQTG